MNSHMGNPYLHLVQDTRTPTEHTSYRRDYRDLSEFAPNPVSLQARGGREIRREFLSYQQFASTPQKEALSGSYQYHASDGLRWKAVSSLLRIFFGLSTEMLNAGTDQRSAYNAQPGS